MSCIPWPYVAMNVTPVKNDSERKNIAGLALYLFIKIKQTGINPAQTEATTAEVLSPVKNPVTIIMDITIDIAIKKKKAMLRALFLSLR